MVGSDPCRVERGGAPERSQRTRQGEKMLTNDDRMGLEGNKRGTRDQSGITGQIGFTIRLGRRSRSQRDIGSGKPSEGTRVSGQAIGGVYVQTVS